MWNSVLLFVVAFYVIQHLLFRLFSNAILTAYSHHRFITLIDCLVVIAVVRNLHNICILYY